MTPWQAGALERTVYIMVTETELRKVEIEPDLVAATAAHDPTLDDPYAVSDSDEARFQSDADIQFQILAHMLSDPDCLAAAQQYVPPSAFTVNAHRMAATIAYSFWEKYGEVVPHEILIGQMKAQVKDRKDSVSILSEVDRAKYGTYTDGGKKYFLDQIREFGVKARLNKAYWELSHGHQDKFWANVDEAREIGSTAQERRFMGDDEIDDLEDPTWQIANHIQPQTLVCIFGPSGSCKTFYSLDMAFSLATGEKFLGEYEVKQGPVLYVSSEGGEAGLKQRRNAWKQHHGISHPITDICFTTASFDLSDRAEAQYLAKQAEAQLGRMPEITFIDTLSMNLGHGDPSDNKDMLKLVRVARFLADLTGGTVVLVHHTGWGDETREMGAKSLRNACDTSIRINKKGEDINVTFVKQRNAKEEAAYVCRQKVVASAVVLEKYGDVAATVREEKAVDMAHDDNIVVGQLPITADPETGLTVAQLEKNLDWNAKRVRRSVTRLVERNVIQQTTPARKSLPVKYSRNILCN